MKQRDKKLMMKFIIIVAIITIMVMLMGVLFGIIVPALTDNIYLIFILAVIAWKLIYKSFNSIIDRIWK